MGVELEITHGGENIDQFALSGRFPKICLEIDRVEAPESEFLGSLPEQCGLEKFAVVDMAAYGGVPQAGEQALLHGTLLDEKFSVAVYDVKVDDRMEQTRASVDIMAGSLPYDETVFLDDRHHLREGP